MKKVMIIMLAAAATAAAAEGDGMLFLQSKPGGAKVFLDDEAAPRGDTPKVLVSIEAGRHRVRFVLDGYEEQVKAFEVSKGAATTVCVELEVKPATLNIIARPAAAQVFVDDKPVELGKPLVLEGGDYRIRAEYAGYQTWERTIAVLPGKVRSVDIHLQKVPEAATAEASATSAEVPAEAGREGGEKKEPEHAAETGEGDEGDKVPKFIDVDCWVCQGTGCIQTMGCLACGGKGFEGFFPCRECDRTGRVPAVCPYCQGAGTLVKGGKQMECPKCNGKGKPICPRCKGTGKITRPNPAAYKGETKACAQCDGTGRVIRQRCSFCSGTGEERSAPARGRWGRGVRIPCYYCKGEGVAPPFCPKCQGTGLVGPDNNRMICPSCAGTGQREVPCPYCKGGGWVPAR